MLYTEKQYGIYGRIEKLMEKPASERIAWVDIVKYICILSVMFNHLDSATNVIRHLCKPFYLTGFYFLSGYVYRPPATFRDHMYRKFRELFVPWLIFSNLNILLSAVISLKGERNTGSELLWNVLQIRGQGDGVWFVAALFVAFIPFWFFVRWNKPVKAIMLAAILSTVSMLFEDLMDPSLLPWGGRSSSAVAYRDNVPVHVLDAAGILFPAVRRKSI